MAISLAQHDGLVGPSSRLDGRIFNKQGQFAAHVTDRIPSGTVWMRDGWEGLNRLTSGRAVLPDAAVDLFHFSAGQAAFDAMVEVTPT